MARENSQRDCAVVGFCPTDKFFLEKLQKPISVTAGWKRYYSTVLFEVRSSSIQIVSPIGISNAYDDHFRDDPVTREKGGSSSSVSELPLSIRQVQHWICLNTS